MVIYLQHLRERTLMSNNLFSLKTFVLPAHTAKFVSHCFCLYFSNLTMDDCVLTKKTICEENERVTEYK